MRNEAQSPMTSSKGRRVNLTSWCRPPRKVRHVYLRLEGVVLTARHSCGSIEYLVQWDNATRSWNRRSKLELVTEQLTLNLEER